MGASNCFCNYCNDTSDYCYRELPWSALNLQWTPRDEDEAITTPKDATATASLFVCAQCSDIDQSFSTVINTCVRLYREFHG